MQAVESEERADAPHPIVEASVEGGRELASAYWREVERTTRGLVRVRHAPEGSSLRALGTSLIRFGPPRIQAAENRVTCRYPIEGGLLARRPGGSITFSQDGSVLSSAISGFHPRLATVPVLYGLIQARIHAAVSRRYFARLVRGGTT